MLRRTIERHRALRVLRSLDALTGLPASELDAVDRLLSEVSVPAGRVLARQGERGLDFALVLDGTAAVTRSGAEIATLTPGTFFGEMALMGNGARTATVTAESDMRLLVANRREFDRLLDAAPRLGVRIARAAAERGGARLTVAA